ncbi:MULTISPECIES: SusC/RagA family TonB-linked outer membrane protein [Olivibacter]|uniref:SusC/RagA family TonB-linked outer membrane protein n=2 Tax=Olivibacter TaxID=376469 RepID=A0ABV6HSF6_9SPHI
MEHPILQTYVMGQWRGLKHYGLAFIVALCMLPIMNAQAQHAIKGRVVDESGKGFPGASIQVKGTSIGTKTNEDGYYSLNVPDINAVLVFSYIGYVSKEVKAAGQSSLNVDLSPNAEALSEVVVVGYGTQRKESVTGSVASISGSDLNQVPTPNISQALQGRLPGVQLAQTSTRPGATMQIRIRGTRSLTADNNPLVVLDGIPFPGSLGDINPNDIKSIDVLKDASATAIYGSRGANGVILVTTNKGQQGEQAKFSYNAYYGAQTLFARYPMMNGEEFVALRKAAGIFSNGVDEADNVNTDWQDLNYRTGAVNSHDIGISGGTEKGSYNVGAAFYQNQGLIPTQQYKRYSLRSSIDQGIGKHFRVGFTTNSNYNISAGNQLGLFGVLAASPILNPYNEDGTLKRTVNASLGDNYVLTRKVVEGLHDDGMWINETRGFATYNSMYGEVNIPWVEGLKYRVNLGLDFIQSNNGNYTGEGVNNVNPQTISTAGISNAHTYHWTVENLITYDKTIAEKHHLNFTGLYSAERQKYNSSAMSARDIPSEAFQFYNLGHATGEITINPDQQNYTLWGLMSWMGRVMYDYDNRYMLSATLRSDASSRLAPEHRWHTYPAVSAGWNVANESFMKGIDWINMLKLRVGYGQTSNQAIAPYATLGRLSTRPYNFGEENYAVGYYVTQLPNSNLGWEFSETWNYGLDFSLLSNRLSGTIEYYTTHTKDLLLGVGLPPTSGVQSYTANIGQTQNKGIELTLNGTILAGGRDGLTWDLGVNLYANRNKLTALASGATQDVGNSWFVGYNINAIYDYEKIGLWQEGDPHLDILEPGGKVGMIKVKYTGGYNDDGTPVRPINADDRQVMNVDPDFEGGFNTRLAYKGFDLSVVGFFKSGGLLVSTLYGSGGYLNTLTTRNNNVKVDYWTPENTDAKYPNPAGPLSGDNPKYGSTLGYFDASFLKLRTISLGYDFNRSLIKSPNMRLRGYFTVQNPFVMFSPYHRESGMDPETNSFGDENSAVSSYPNRILTIGTNAPATRNYVVGLNLVF